MIHISNPNGLISSTNIDISHRGRKRRKRGSGGAIGGGGTAAAAAAATAVGSNSASDELDDGDEEEGEYEADDEEEDEDELATNDADSDRLHDMTKLHIPFWDKYDAVNQLYLDMGKYRAPYSDLTFDYTSLQCNTLVAVVVRTICTQHNAP